jgi:hypothetical protein
LEAQLSVPAHKTGGSDREGIGGKLMISLTLVSFRTSPNNSLGCFGVVDVANGSRNLRDHCLMSWWCRYSGRLRLWG